jgi:hypothetical protein
LSSPPRRASSSTIGSARPRGRPRRAADGKWAAFEVGLIVGRQNGKGAVLEARELAGLFLFGEQLILHSAHEFKTAAEAFRRVLSLVQNTPDLEKLVKQVRTSHGDEGIELRSGARLRFVARSTGSGRGFSGDVVILDEAYNLPGSAMGALAADDGGAAESAGLVRVQRRERGLRGPGEGPGPRREGKPGRLAYFEWSAKPDADLDDPPAGCRRIRASASVSTLSSSRQSGRRCRRSNSPGSGSESGLTGAATPRSTVFCGIRWPIPSARTGRRSRSPSRSTRSAPRRRSPPRSSAADGFVQLESIDYRPGTAWILDRAAALNADWAPIGFVLNPSAPAGSLIPAMQALGIEPILVTGREEVQACGAFFDALVDRKIRHGNQGALNIAVEQAAKRPIGDAWVWHRRSVADIGPLNGATLAHHVVSRHVEESSEPWAEWLDV